MVHPVTTFPPPAATNAGAGVGSGPVKPVAATSPAASPGNDPARSNVSKPPAKIGEVGYAFKFDVGTPQGQDERRQHNTLYKQSRRAGPLAVAKQMVSQSALPPVDPAKVSPEAPATNRDSAAAPGPGSSPGDPPPIPWTGELLTSLVDELLKAAEENRVAAFVAKCEEARITGDLLKEIEADAHFPKPAKILLKQSLPRLAAKWLNKTGVSAEFYDEAAVVTAVLLIVQSDRKNGSKLDELIEQRKAASKVQEKSNSPAPMQPAVVPDPPRPLGAPTIVVAKPVSEPTLS